MASRDALIVATGSYEDAGLRQLRAPAKDAAVLAQVLADPGIGAFQVREVVDQPHYRIAREIEGFFGRRSLDDLLLVHLSCHGIKHDDGRLFFATTNTELGYLESTSVSAAYLKDLMERCRARSIVLLLDCCYSGAMLAAAKGDRGVHLNDRLGGHGRAILTASTALEYAWVREELSGEGQQSVFTAAIADGLRSGEADRDRDGNVSVTELYNYVYDRVLKSKQGQTPQLWVNVEQDVYLARNPFKFVKRELDYAAKILPVGSEQSRLQVSRRAARLAPVLEGARLLLVNDVPSDMRFVISIMEGLGVHVDVVSNSDDALAALAEGSYDLVISDMRRGNIMDAGIRFLSEARARGLHRPTIFTVGAYQPDRGTPPYAFGITNRVDELLNLSFDVLERVRG